MVSLPDNEIKEKAESIANELYQAKIKELSVDQRRNVAKMLKKETGTSTKQVARVVGIRKELLKELI